jgi:hypothetical protein
VRWGSESARHLSDFRDAKREWSSRLLVPDRKLIRATAQRRPIQATQSANVQAIGIGYKVTSGRVTDALAVKFFVRMKHLAADLTTTEMLPSSIAGLPTDVNEVGLISPLSVHMGSLNARQRLRPARPGCSVGFAEADPQELMAGTIGAVVADADATYLLSNNHVLADQNRLPFGAPIFEPGLLDGGDPEQDQIAELTAYVPLDTESPNVVDCAIARLLDESLATADILRLGYPAGVGSAAIDMSVAKSGRTTGLTRGVVVSVDTDIQVAYDIGNLVFQGQIAIESTDGGAFSDAGDSGSLVVDLTSGQAIGLLFCGSDTIGFANHLSDVLSVCGVDLVVAANS